MGDLGWSPQEMLCLKAQQNEFTFNKRVIPHKQTQAQAYKMRNALKVQSPYHIS